MTLAQGFIAAAITALILVAFLHSYFGETRLLSPLFKHQGNSILENDFARKVLRYAWHLTSLLWIMIAICLYAVAFHPTDLSTIVLLTIGIGFLFIGLFDLVVSRGRHIGWPALTAIGIFSLAAYVAGGVSL